jgi:glycosyltransferase involved in cell wall biosynthesis
VIAGALGGLARYLDAALARSRVARDAVVLAGHVDDADLGALYAGAECLLHPALDEGFGLTPLESLAAGTPVVAYDVGAVREVVGDAGVLVDPRVPGSLGDALLAVVESGARRAELASRAPSRVAAFSWDRAAERTVAVYRSLA